MHFFSLLYLIEGIADVREALVVRDCKHAGDESGLHCKESIEGFHIGRSMHKLSPLQPFTVKRIISLLHNSFTWYRTVLIWSFRPIFRFSKVYSCSPAGQIFAPLSLFPSFGLDCRIYTISYLRGKASWPSVPKTVSTALIFSPHLSSQETGPLS